MSKAITNPDYTIIVDTNPKSPISEAYRTLRTNIEFSALDTELKVIMVTSSQAEEGKTTTAVNLAAAYAQANKRVVIVDSDLRRPMLHQVFGLSNRGGLTNILANQHTIQELTRETTINNLSVITSGPIPPNPSEMLASNRMSEFVEELRGLFDVVIIDTAPVLAVTDAQLVSTRCDGVVLVISAGKIKRELARKAQANLEHVKARILGVVLNNVDKKSADSYYYYYYGHRK